MEKQEARQRDPAGRKQKKRSPKAVSLTRRLSWHFFRKAAAGALALDLVLALIFAGGLLLRTEVRIGGLVEEIQQTGVPEDTGLLAAAGYAVTWREGALQAPGGALRVFSSWLPESTRAGVRGFTGGAGPGAGGGLLAAYQVSVPWGEGVLTVTADLSEPVSIAVYALVILAVCQVISLFADLGEDRKYIRRALSPIRTLTETAQAVNVGMSPEELSRLAGKLDQINTAHLDTRVTVAGGQKELKALVQAINAMLERIDQGYRAQARFVSDASHELRTPIAVIQGYANLLDRWGKDDPDTRQEAITAIRAEADAMKELVEQLLFLARGDNDSMHIQMEELDLSALAAEVFQETEMIDQTHRLELRAEPGVRAVADDGLMKQALRVLVDNALKYTAGGGQVTVGLRRQGETARLWVSDEGQGISGEDLPQVFDRFYRTDQSRARQTGGTGLGLSICRWIVERHGGWIEVVSRQDFGSRFTICLPALPPRREESPGPEPDTASEPRG